MQYAESSELDSPTGQSGFSHSVRMPVAGSRYQPHAHATRDPSRGLAQSKQQQGDTVSYMEQSSAISGAISYGVNPVAEAHPKDVEGGVVPRKFGTAPPPTFSVEPADGQVWLHASLP